MLQVHFEKILNSSEKSIINTFYRGIEIALKNKKAVKHALTHVLPVNVGFDGKVAEFSLRANDHGGIMLDCVLRTDTIENDGAGEYSIFAERGFSVGQIKALTEDHTLIKTGLTSAFERCVSLLVNKLHTQVLRKV